MIEKYYKQHIDVIDIINIVFILLIGDESCEVYK